MAENCNLDTMLNICWYFEGWKMKSKFQSTQTKKKNKQVFGDTEYRVPTLPEMSHSRFFQVIFQVNFHQCPGFSRFLSLRGSAKRAIFQVFPGWIFKAISQMKTCWKLTKKPIFQWKIYLEKKSSNLRQIKWRNHHYIVYLNTTSWTRKTILGANCTRQAKFIPKVIFQPHPQTLPACSPQYNREPNFQVIVTLSRGFTAILRFFSKKI